MHKRCSFLLAVLTVTLVMCAAAACRADAVYQWSVKVPGSPKKRAYLWIPPRCRHVRGLIFAMQNMLEEPMLGSPIIRKAAAAAGLGIVWVAPGNIGSHDSGLCVGNQFGPPAKAGRQLQAVLNRLAKQSGYEEIKYAPLLIVGHSAAAAFVYGIAAWDAGRIIALLPDKCGFPSAGQSRLQPGIPVFHVESEWAEWGAGWGSLRTFAIRDFINARNITPTAPAGEFIDVGAGHFDNNPAAANIIAMFIREAVRYRVPPHAPMNRPVHLLPVNMQRGWVINIKDFYTTKTRVMPAAKFRGNPADASWYFSKKLAVATNNFMARGFAKQPQMIDFLVHRNAASLKKQGFANIAPHFTRDKIKFNVHAVYLNHSPTSHLFPGLTLGHAPVPIKYWTIGSGGLKQTGPHTFRVWLRRGGVRRQGAPWEPWVIAYSPGNTKYRSADRPAHIWLPVKNTAGKPQQIKFSAIANVFVGIKHLQLHATTNLHRPVQFFVVSGPVQLAANNRTLTFLRIPVRAQFPMKVTLGAYQWGSPAAPRVQSAGPVYRSFYIKTPRGRPRR